MISIYAFPIDQTSSQDVTVFGTGKIVLSIGMGIVALLSIPLGYWNLDDNIIVQNVALLVIILSLGAQGVQGLFSR